MAMTKRARVLAALRGEPVDRVPLSFWLHNFVTENSAAGLAAETLRLARTFDWDFLKPQSRAQCFAEMWGLSYRPSTERATPFTVTHTPLAGAAEVARLQPVDPRRGRSASSWPRWPRSARPSVPTRRSSGRSSRR